MRLHLVRRSAAAAGVAVALLCVLVGCGTSSTPTSSTPNQTSPPAMTTAAPSGHDCSVDDGHCVGGGLRGRRGTQVVA